MPLAQIIMSKFALLTLLLLLVCDAAHAQGTSYYEDTQFDPFQRKLYFVGKDRPQTAFRAYNIDDLQKYFNTDSLIYSNVKAQVHTRAKLFNDFFNGDFIHFASKNENVYVAINPLFDFELGRDANQDGSSNTWVNSRGFYVDGHLGKKFWFYCDLTENQAFYADYYNRLSDSLQVVPGLSNYRIINETDFDFETATGYVAFRVAPWIDFLIGKTKTFIGDGYRSLLLGDAAVAVPTFRMNVKFLGAKYSIMATQLKERKQAVVNNGYRSKYSFTHFLEWNMGRRYTLGVFENVTQASWRKNGDYRGVDWEYLNPFAIFRPGEFNAGSPDKMIVGLTSKFICTDWLTLYGQIMFNEFRLKELTAGTGYWSNKYAFQIGAKTFNIFRCDGLDFQAEYNQARPFCYSQYDALGCYTHLNQSMAHPLGANFKEGIFILNYHHGRAQARAQVNIAKYGDDFPGDTVTYGHNPTLASDTRNAQYGVHTLQGLKTELHYFDVSGSFIINPKSMLNVSAGLRIRTRESEQTSEYSRNFYVALRWSLKSKYYDY